MPTTAIPKRERKVTIRFQQAEYEALQERFRQTTHRKFSGYLRDMVLHKPIVTKYRNQSADEFLAAALQLKKELNAIGNNYNQAVKKLHLLSDTGELRQWLLGHQSMHQELLQKVREIGLRMDKMYQACLRK